MKTDCEPKATGGAEGIVPIRMHPCASMVEESGSISLTDSSRVVALKREFYELDFRTEQLKPWVARDVNAQPVNQTKNKSMKAKKQALVVTTEHRGVFFGYGTVTQDKIIRLEEARMCVYWSTDVKGVVGLAANGPTKGCRVGPAAPSITLQGVTSIMEVSATAEAQWKQQPWS